MIEPKVFWETCRSNYAHLKPTWEMIKGEIGFNRIVKFKEAFLNEIKIDNKVIVDYGCGGGFLGKYLYEEYNIKKYIGIDIAERSLRKAWQVMRDLPIDQEFLITPVRFDRLNADVFISIACIQHFNSQEYLDDFLENLNDSGIDKLMLHIKWAEENEFFNTYGREAKRGYGVCCRTNREYMGERLSNYKSVNTMHNYTIWELK